MEKQKKNQNSALAVLAMLVAVLVVIFLIVPRVSAIKDLSNQIVDKESQLKQGQAQVDSVKQFAAILKTARADIAALGVAIPTEEKADEAVLQVASAASKAGVNVTSVSVSTTSAAAPRAVAATQEGAATDQAEVTSATSSASSGSLQVSVSIRGNYGATLDLLKKLEENLRPVTLKNLSIASNAESGSDVDSSFNLDFPFAKAAVADQAATTSPEAQESTEVE